MQPTTIHVRQAKAGDPDSLAWLIERFSPLLLAQARFRMRDRNLGQDPEDLVQDVWSVTLPQLPELGDRAGRETPVLVRFLATTLLYRFNELLRRKIRIRQGHVGEPSRPLELPDSTQGALTRAAASDEHRRILAAIDELPEVDREVVVLRAIEQVDNAEVAALLDQTPNAVSLRYNRALGKLRDRLGTSVFDELTEKPENS